MSEFDEYIVHGNRAEGKGRYMANSNRVSGR